MELDDLYCTEVWRTVKGDAVAAAATPWPVLVTGPRGSGKSLLARFIHRNSPRASAPFVESPAPTLAEGLLHSEIRGHAKYAFTDAQRDHSGVLERAHGGTLFFDEIEAASPALQALLVSLVEQPQVTRLGEERARQVDVRFLYATNADLPRLVAERRFRADLLDRIRCHEIRVPALREYGLARLAIAERFLADALATLQKDWQPEFSTEAVLCFLQYDWPGNLRELHSVCRHIAAHQQGPSVMLRHLPGFLREVLAPDPTRAANRAVRASVEQALAATAGNQAAASRLLGVSTSKFKRWVSRVRRMTPDGGVSRKA